MRKKFAIAALVVTLPVAGLAGAALAEHHSDKSKLIASAAGAAPASIAKDATYKDLEGNVLKEGTNGYTCYPQGPVIGPMCNDAQWEALMGAFMTKADYTPTGFGVSYMLMGDGDSAGVSNIDPFASEPTADNDWVKEGPHLMLILPGDGALDGISTDPADPVYVMWKGTPYQHVMVRVGD